MDSLPCGILEQYPERERDGYYIHDAVPMDSNRPN
jgi:hypothetical protein